MTASPPEFSPEPRVPDGSQAVRLSAASAAYLAQVGPGHAGEAELLASLDAFLGGNAPLLAYTRLTGEAWVRSRPAEQHAQASALLDSFRAYLRDHGWLDRARPVNVLD